MHQRLELCREKLLASFHMSLLVVKKMGGRHSKPENRARTPLPPPPPLPRHPCPCVYPHPYPPPPPNSYWGRKPPSHPVSLPSSMASSETSSIPSSNGELAPAPAKIRISKSSETIQLKDVRIKVRRARVKTDSRSVHHMNCDIEVMGRKGGSY